MFGKYLQNVRDTAPLIHNITNYVTVNDCANILLACGASPIMADDPQEVEAITSICAGLTINIGTLNSRTIVSIQLAGKRAGEIDHPIVLDPVGVGASPLRTHTGAELVRDLPVSVVRGNASEMKVLGGVGEISRGVDANAVDKITDANVEKCMQFALQLANSWHTIIAMSGQIDIVTDGKRSYIIRNGHPLMSRITGSGCMLSALTAAYITAAKKCQESTVESVAAAFCSMGIAGEIAAKRMQGFDGTASFRTYLIDAIANMTAQELENNAKCEELTAI